MQNPASHFLKVTFGCLLLAFALSFGAYKYIEKQSQPGGDFSLQHEDVPWTFSDHAKDLNLLYFGYAKCPDVCPMTLSAASQAIAKLPEDQSSKLRLIFVSVDIENDTPKDVSLYAQQFSENFVGLTGSKESMIKALETFGAHYIVEPMPDSYLGYSIAHTDRLYFLNRRGKVIETLQQPRSSQVILEKIKETL